MTDPAPGGEVHGRPPPSGGLLANAGALVSSRLVVAALGWAGTILIVRALSAEEWGQFSIIFTVLGTFSFMTSLGSSRIVLTELARRPDSAGSYAGTYIVLRLVLGACAYVSAVVFVLAADYPSEVVVGTALAGGILMIAAAGAGLDVVFQSEFRLGVVATASVVGQVGQLALTVLVALTEPSLLLFLLPAVAYDVIAAWWKARRVGRLMRLRLTVDVGVWKSILVQAAPLAVGSAAATVALSVDLLVLSWVDTFEAVGALAVADKFVLVVAFVPMAVEPPLVATLVRFFPEQLDRFYATVRRATLLMSVAAGLVLVGFLPAADHLMALLYGEEYRTAATAARLSVGAGCVQFYGYVLLAALVAMGRHRLFLWLNIAALGCTLVASLALVPPLSVLGAGMARLVAALVMLVVFTVVVRRLMDGRVLDGRSQALVGACCLAATGTGVLLVQVLWWPAASLGAVLTYAVLLQLTRATGPAGLRSLAVDDSGPVSRSQGPSGAGEEPGQQ